MKKSMQDMMPVIVISSRIISADLNPVFTETASEEW